MTKKGYALWMIDELKKQVPELENMTARTGMLISEIAIHGIKLGVCRDGEFSYNDAFKITSRTRAARMGHNPRTRAEIRLPEKIYLGIKPAPFMSRALNNGSGMTEHYSKVVRRALPAGRQARATAEVQQTTAAKTPATRRGRRGAAAAS